MMVNNSKTRDSDFVPAIGTATVRLTDVIEIFDMINRLGDLRKLAQLSEGAEHVVQIPPETVNVVKEFVAGSPAMRKDEIGKKVLRPVEQTVSLASMTKGGATRMSNCRCGFCSGG